MDTHYMFDRIELQEVAISLAYPSSLASSHSFLAAVRRVG
jgi:hypothetical protein